MQVTSADLIELSTPTREELSAAFADSLRLSPGPIPKEEGSARNWSEETIRATAADLGIEITQDEINNILAGDMTSSSAALISKAVSVSAAQAGAELGIDPALAGVTIDALMDGKLTPSELENIAAATGAVIGAAVAFPVGATIGGAIGQFIGGAVASYIGLGQPSDEERARWAREYAEHFNQIHEAAVSRCTEIRSMYWREFDLVYSGLIDKLGAFEGDLGLTIDLKWFDAIPSVSGFDVDLFEMNPFAYKPDGSLRKGVFSDECITSLIETGTEYTPEEFRDAWQYDKWDREWVWLGRGSPTCPKPKFPPGAFDPLERPCPEFEPEGIFEDIWEFDKSKKDWVWKGLGEPKCPKPKFPPGAFDSLKRPCEKAPPTKTPTTKISGTRFQTGYLKSQSICFYMPKSLLGEKYPQDLGTPKHIKNRREKIIYNAFKAWGLIHRPKEKTGSEDARVTACNPQSIYKPISNFQLPKFTTSAKIVIDREINRLIAMHSAGVRIAGDMVQSAAAAAVIDEIKPKRKSSVAAPVVLAGGIGLGALALLARR